MPEDDTARGGAWSRRALLAAVGIGGSSALVSGLTGDGTQGNLYGGTMALSQAYNVAEDLWIGPDSSKSNVSAESGRLYMATDTQVEYYGDNGSWTKLGVGSSSEAVPSVTTDDATVNNELVIPSYTDFSSVPTGKSAGFLAVTEDGHLVLEDGQ